MAGDFRSASSPTGANDGQGSVTGGPHTSGYQTAFAVAAFLICRESIMGGKSGLRINGRRVKHDPDKKPTPLSAIYSLVT